MKISATKNRHFETIVNVVVSDFVKYLFVSSLVDLLKYLWKYEK